MKTQSEILSKLHEHQSPTPSKWKENAEWRIANKSWLRYSQKIAMMMLDRMEELGLTQKSVAEKMGCSQQYISRILKGTENLSIETISKIESALGLKIMEMSAISH
ncbi:MAG: helix-turn-helix transcriptional regulator [Muribaculaceae bacterium]|nr:helix-turn-helix transcriptional regulator [Muribaculaceae bacterium]